MLHFGVSKPRNSRPKAYIFDLDGVLYRGDEAVEGAAEAVARLRALEPAPRLFFLTNNSSQPRSVFAEKLTRLGMPATPDEVVTSSSATAAYLTTLGDVENKTALVVGGPGISDELGRIGMRTLAASDTEASQEKADYVVVGLDRSFNYEKMLRAQQAILHGATFIATNRDGQFPIEGGRVTPGAGAVVAAIEACTNVTPTVIGKPETLGLEMILHQIGADAHEAVMIGDRLDTDILCGNRLRVPTVLVLTGLTTLQQAVNAVPPQKPGRVIASLAEL